MSSYSNRTSNFSSASVSPRGGATPSAIGTSTPTMRGYNMSSETPGSGHLSGSATPGGYQSSVSQMSNVTAGSTEGNNLYLISPTSAAVVNLPVEPTSFAPVEIDTNDVSLNKKCQKMEKREITKRENV